MPRGRKPKADLAQVAIATEGELPSTKPKVIPSGSNVIGTQNDDRLKLFNTLADQVDEIRSAEMEGIGEDDDDEEAEQADEGTPSPDQEQERAEPADDDDPDADQVDKKDAPPPESKKYKLKVNGKERELTEDELIERASKVEAADDYLREAANTYKQAQKATQPSQADVEAKAEQDDLALARAIQMGDEAEAVKAIRKLRASPSFNQDDLARLVDERLTFQNAANQFSAKYPEITSDPLLLRLVLEEDARLLKEGDQRSYLERYSAIGDSVRAWVGKFKQEKVSADKQARKESVSTIRPASVRAESKPDEEPDDTPAALIAQMAKARGQRV